MSHHAVATRSYQRYGATQETQRIPGHVWQPPPLIATDALGEGFKVRTGLRLLSQIHRIQNWTGHRVATQYMLTIKFHHAFNLYIFKMEFPNLPEETEF